MAKRSKYDTNPLDPEVAEQTEEVWGNKESGPPTERVKGATRPVSPAPEESPRSNVYSEAPTRRYNTTSDSSYPSVLVPPTYSPPSPYQPQAVPQYQPPVDQRPTSRPVAGLRLPEKWVMVLPYAPFYIGVVASIIELLLVPREEVRVRFHAAQGLALNLAIEIIKAGFLIIGAITGSSIGGTLSRLAAFIFLIISMLRVWKGEAHRLAPLGEPTNWLNERIEPRR